MSCSCQHITMWQSQIAVVEPLTGAAASDVPSAKQQQQEHVNWVWVVTHIFQVKDVCEALCGCYSYKPLPRMWHLHQHAKMIVKANAQCVCHVEIDKEMAGLVLSECLGHGL